MMINSAMGSAIQGMQSNQRSFLSAAQRISRFGTSGGLHEVEGFSMEKDMVQILTSKRGYEANLKVVKVADEMLGTLIDTLA